MKWMERKIKFFEIRKQTSVLIFVMILVEESRLVLLLLLSASLCVEAVPRGGNEAGSGVIQEGVTDGEQSFSSSSSSSSL